MQTALDSLAKIFDESDAGVEGMRKALDNIYSSLQAMHDSPNVKDPIFEADVRTKMQALTNLLNEADRQITEAEQLERQRLDGTDTSERGAVQEVNDILMQIGNLNRQIKQNQILGQQSLELMDERNVLLDELSRRTGRKIIGNKSASGTEIFDELAEEEIAEGHMIVYTSADSVLQICGNEETFGLEELYRCCEIAREITMKDEWKVGRVIARPYVGRRRGEFKRTSNRHDYALKPYGRTALNALKDAGFDVISVGKIFDIFDGEGITESNKSKSSVHGMEQTIEIAKRDFEGLCFVNLVDFDALWGHRRDVIGYAKELEKFDVKLGEFLPLLHEDDLLIITADHGNDPTHTGTDHTREKVPFLAYSPSMKGSGKLEDTQTFAVIGATIADNFGIDMPEGTIGTSVLEKLL